MRSGGRSVHPRACGERSSRVRGRLRANGSSPRLRGTLGAVARVLPGVRFIPAPAGNAESGGHRNSRRTVHPRACGERQKRKWNAERERGSSPRLRGTLEPPVAVLGPERFIPAPAGNAAPTTSMATQSTVHPRACGERHCSVVKPSWRAGSSPRLRGTLSSQSALSSKARFIPAPAGNA